VCECGVGYGDWGLLEEGGFALAGCLLCNASVVNSDHTQKTVLLRVIR